MPDDPDTMNATITVPLRCEGCGFILVAMENDTLECWSPGCEFHRVSWKQPKIELERVRP